MTGTRSLRPVLTIALLAGALVPATASATLVYTSAPARGTPVLYAAADDGSQRVRLGSGYSQPNLSPDGTMVAAVRQSTRGAPSLSLLSTTNAFPPRRLLRTAVLNGMDWSPDSSALAVIGRSTLIRIDAASGGIARLARGTFTWGDPSWSADGSRIAYSKARSSRINSPTNIYTVPATGGSAARLTSDGRSSAPVFGPTQIAFSRGPARRRDYPKLQVWTMAFDGSGARRVTRVRIGKLVSGLNPVAFSADGTRLAAQFTGQDTSQGFAVTLATGAARDIGRRSFDGTAAYGISRDGGQILAATGFPDLGPGPGQNVVSIPFGGGTPTVLARRATWPDWNR